MPPFSGHFYLALVAFTSLASVSYGFQMTVDVDAEECFYEKLAQQDKLAIIYDVVDGGFRDIQFYVIGPDLKLMHDDRLQSTRVSSNGRYTFSAFKTGLYEWCFANRQTSASLKEIKFLIEVQNGSSIQHELDDKLDNTVSIYMKELKSSLKFIKYEAEYSINAMFHLHELNERVNFVVTGWGMFELLFFLAVILSQVIYLRMLFEKRVSV